MGVTASEARVATLHAQRYMTQLCKHWAHKFPVAFDERRGRIELPAGACALEADPDRLLLRAEAADAADLARLEEVVQKHIERFAFRETLTISWVRSPPL